MARKARQRGRRRGKRITRSRIRRLSAHIEDQATAPPKTFFQQLTPVHIGLLGITGFFLWKGIQR